MGWRLLALLCVTIVGFSTGAATSKAESATFKTCKELLGSIKMGKEQLNQSQAARLIYLMENLPESESKQLFETLKGADLTNLILKLQAKEQNEVPPEVAAILLDFAQFGESFPGLFQLDDSITVASQILSVIRSKEKSGSSKVSNGDLLRSQSLASQFKITINSTIVNLIQQAELEYANFDFNQGFWKKQWHKIRRFFSPSYNRVLRVTQLGQDFQRQLHRLALVDRLIIDHALAKAKTLGFTEEELAEMTFQVLNSPDEINELETKAKKVFGGRFAKNTANEVGKFDIFKAGNVVDSVDLSELYEKFDVKNLEGLDKLTSTLNEARKRKKQSELTMADMDVRELQIRIEATERRVRYYNKIYQSWTEQDSSEKYRLQRWETVSYPCTKTDKDGKSYSTTCTKQELVWKTYIPSFEEILSNDYDEGSGSVTGLDEVIERAAKVFKSEAPARKLVAATEEFYETLMEEYQSILSGKGKEKATLQKQIKEYLEKLRPQIDAQEKYATMSAQEIREQYSKDSVENFRNRNSMMLNRLQNMRDALTMISEALRRAEWQIYPIYDLFDFSNWLMNLKSIRNWNYGKKVVMGAVPPALLGWYVSPRFQNFIDLHPNDVADMVQNTLQALGMQ